MTTISIERHTTGNGGLRLAITGELDTSTTELLNAMIRNAIIAGPIAELVVDLDRVTSCDSAGISVLLTGHNLAIEQGTPYQVINAHDILRRTLNLAGVPAAPTCQS